MFGVRDLFGSQGSVDDLNHEEQSRRLVVMETDNGDINSPSNRILLTLSIDSYDRAPQKALKAVLGAIEGAKGYVNARYIDNGAMSHEDRTWGHVSNLDTQTVTAELNELGLFPQMTVMMSQCASDMRRLN